MRLRFGWARCISKQRNDGEERGDFLPNSRNVLLFFAQNKIWVFHGVIARRGVYNRMCSVALVESEEIRDGSAGGKM